MIEVRDLYKSFKLPNEKASGVKQALTNFAKGVKGYTKQEVLRGINFEIKEGDFFGIVGRNGSGKSTLLKLLSQIYTPDSGSISVNGSLVPFIELGVGFNPELTGRQNVYMNGAMLGFSNKEVDDMYEEIVEFAELHDFMDQKLKNYSSGMQVRLAFSCAIRAKTDILILDEILAVGDEAFQRKCNEYFNMLKKDKKTVVLVTHSMDAVQTYCNKAILIQDGEIIEDKGVQEVAQKYRRLNESEDTEYEEETENELSNNYINLKATATSSEDLINIDINVEELERLEDPLLGFEIISDSNQRVFRWISDEKTKEILDFSKKSKFHFELQNIFPVGKYSLMIVVKSRDRSKTYGTVSPIANFQVKPTNSYQWDTLFHPIEKFEIK
ncbi:MAG: ATP-binding cassette domain-containing protein [Bifidobacteriaceae bacterium]|nr:ATP-binding cassette domain-containing protein [Bifidobacteriaceae bacterium]